MGGPAFRRLTAEEHATWETNGYLLIPGVLTTGQIEQCRAAVDRLSARYGRELLAAGQAFERVNVIEDNPALLDLIDHPVMLGAAMDLMGAAVHLLVSTVTCRPPSAAPAIRWHTDDPSPYFFPRVNGQVPVWQLKCCLYLTDVEEPYMGNFVAAPGSHRHGIPKPVPGADGALDKDRYLDFPDVDKVIPGALQVTAKAGDLLMFHPGLWHCVAPNRSDRTRKNLWYVFGPLWMRLGDRIASSPELVAASDPVRRQLLGATTIPERSALAPRDEGAPLIKIWEGVPYEGVWRRERDRLFASWWAEEGGNP
jgi:hypothetical protein